MFSISKSRFSLSLVTLLFLLPGLSQANDWFKELDRALGLYPGKISFEFAKEALLLQSPDTDIPASPSEPIRIGGGYIILDQSGIYSYSSPNATGPEYSYSFKSSAPASLVTASATIAPSPVSGAGQTGAAPSASANLATQPLPLSGLRIVLDL